MMHSNKDSLIEIIKIFSTEPKQRKLLKKAEGLYLMHSFKIKSMSPFEAEQCFDKLQEKYETKEIKPIANQWHKNERRLFLWYLICYCEENTTSIQNITEDQWFRMGHIFFSKSELFLKFQALTILKNIKRHLWTQQDDRLLEHNVSELGKNSWNQVSKRIFFNNMEGRFISPKQCRERYFNHVCKQTNKNKWTKQQDIFILKMSLEIGKKWSQIARQLNTFRTQHMVKNRFNSIVKTFRRKKSQSQISIVKRTLKILQEQYQKDQKQKHVEKGRQQQDSKKNLKKEMDIIETNARMDINLPVIPKIKENTVYQVTKIKQEKNGVHQLAIQDSQQNELQQIIKKSQQKGLVKGIVLFNKNNSLQEQVVANSQIGDNSNFPLTPSTIKPISPFSLNFFKSFDNYANRFQKKRKDGSNLFSPSPLNPSPISPGISGYFSHSTSPGFRRSSSIQQFDEQLEQDLRKITKKKLSHYENE